MRLVDVEKQIKELIAEDVSNPEIYDKIYKLMCMFLNYKKLVSDYSDVDNIALLAAEDLFLKLQRGVVITSWIGYINRCYHAYIRMWRKMSSTEIIDVTTDRKLEEAIIEMCSASSSSESIRQDYNRIYDYEYLENIPKIVERVLGSSKYIKDTSEYLNAYLSILLSLQKHEYISYNQTEDNKRYTRLIYNKTCDMITENVKTLASCVDEDGRMSLLQLHALSNADIISE